MPMQEYLRNIVFFNDKYSHTLCLGINVFNAISQVR